MQPKKQFLCRGLWNGVRFKPRFLVRNPIRIGCRCPLCKKRRKTTPNFLWVRLMEHTVVLFSKSSSLKIQANTNQALHLLKSPGKNIIFPVVIDSLQKQQVKIITKRIIFLTKLKKQNGELPSCRVAPSKSSAKLVAAIQHFSWPASGNRWHRSHTRAATRLRMQPLGFAFHAGEAGTSTGNLSNTLR